MGWRVGFLNGGVRGLRNLKSEEERGSVRKRMG